MEKNKITWCLKQKRGISFIKPNIIISENYFNRARIDLNNLNNQDDVWKIIVSYYICYNAFYSILIRYGIKSEIHSCTLELLNYFEYIKKYYDFFDDLKEQRTNVQYYLKEPGKINFLEIKTFVDYCELELSEVNQSKIDELRNKLENG